MASDITVTSLTAVGGVKSIALSAMWVSPLGMGCLSYMQAAAVNFYMAATNNFSSASLIGRSDVGVLVVDILDDGATRYFWARAEDPSGNLGPRYPSGGGVSATTQTVTPGPGSITEQMLADNAVSTRVFRPGITPVEIFATLPSTGNYAGRMVYRTVDGKLYRHTGSPSGSGGFTAAVPAGDLSGQITGTQISDGAISTPQLAANAVTADKIVAGAVSAAKMSVAELAAITANLGTVNAGRIEGVTINGSAITGGIIQTASSGTRIDIRAFTNSISAFIGSQEVVRIGGVLGSGGWDAPVTSQNSSGTICVLGASSGGSNVASGVFIRTGTGVGVQGTANSTLANTNGTMGFNNHTGGGAGAMGLSQADGGYGVYAIRGGYGPFTGSHDGLILKGDPAEPGDIVYDKRVMARNGWGDTLTEVGGSSEHEHRGIVGVIDRRVALDPETMLSALPAPEHGPKSTFVRRKLAEKYDRVKINALGEGQMNVCGRGGDLEPGDLICASDMAGKGQRQNDTDGEADDLVRRCTVAKARERVTFDDPDQVKLVSVIYLCG